MKEQLKPCPFCGGEPRVREFVGATEIHCCNTCPTRPRLRIASNDIRAPTYEQAVAAWNTRAPMTALTTPPTGEEGEALIEWLTGLVNEGGDAPIEIPVRDMKLLLSLLPPPRVEEVRREAFREAVDAVDKALENGSPRETWTAAEIAMDEDREAAIEAIHSLSPQGE